MKRLTYKHEASRDFVTRVGRGQQCYTLAEGTSPHGVVAGIDGAIAVEVGVNCRRGEKDQLQ